MENLMANLWWIAIWVVLGLVAGAIAKLIMPGKDGGGYLSTALLGIAGALVGGFIASSLNLVQGSMNLLVTIVFAVIGSLILLTIYRLVTGRSVTG